MATDLAWISSIYLTFCVFALYLAIHNAGVRCAAHQNSSDRGLWLSLTFHSAGLARRSFSPFKFSFFFIFINSLYLIYFYNCFHILSTRLNWWWIGSASFCLLVIFFPSCTTVAHQICLFFNKLFCDVMPASNYYVTIATSWLFFCTDCERWR